MADKLIVYKVEDQETGKIYQIEGPEGATPDELGDFLLSQQNQPQAKPSVSAPVATPTPQREWAQPTPAQKVMEGQSGFDKLAEGAKPVPLDEQQSAEYLRMVGDPNVPDSAIADFFTKTNRPFASDAEQADFAAQRQQYLKNLAEGGAPASDVSYRDRAQEVLGDYVQQEDTGTGGLGAALEEGMAYNPMGIVTRAIGDWADSETVTGVSKDELRKRFPKLSEDAIESLQDDIMGERRRRELMNAGSQVEQKNVNPFVRVAGNLIGGVSPADAVPLGRGATAVGRIAEGAAANVIADAAMQGQDVSYGAQGEYDYLQTAQAGLEGAGLQGVIESVVKGAGLLASTARRTEDRRAPDRPTDEEYYAKRDAYEKEAREVVAKGGTEQDVKAIAAKYGMENARVNLDDVLEQRAKQITIPTARKNSKAYKQQVTDSANGMVDHVNTMIEGWENAPTFEVYDNFKTLKDVDNDALGAATGDGRVLINAQNVLAEAKRAKKSPEEILSAVTYHEALGHYGLAQKFGDGLEAVLNQMYTNSSPTFKNKVDKWLADNPNEYANDPNRELRAAEEVLAEMSENGQLPVTFVNKITNLVKDFARQMGLNLKFSEREIKTILGMSHAAVVSGKGRDVVGNGFRYMYAGDRARGYDPDSEYNFMGPDGKVRWEISDFNSRFNDRDLPYLENGETYALPDMLHHPELYEAYPSLRDYGLRIEKDKPGAGGYFDVKNSAIVINPDFKGRESIKSVVLHEIQHAIQSIENWSRGGNPATALNRLDPEHLRTTAKNFAKWKAKELEVEAKKLDTLTEFANNPLVKKWRSTWLHAKSIGDYADPEYMQAEADLLESMGLDYDKIIEDEYIDDWVDLTDIFLEDRDPKLVLNEKANEFYSKMSRLDYLVNRLDTERDSLLIKALYANDKDGQLAFQAYEALFGELEARDTQARMNMGMPERRAKAPYSERATGVKESEWVVDNTDEIPLNVTRYSKPKKREPTDEERIINAKEILSGVMEGYEPTVRSWAEGKRAAKDLGLTNKQIKSAKSIGELDKRLFQYEAVADATDSQLVALHEKMNDGTFTLRDKQKYLETIYSYNELMARIFDDQAEIGRALNAMKALTFTKRKVSELNNILGEFEGSGINAFADEEVFNRFAKQVQNMLATDNPNGVHNLLKSVMKPYWWQYVLSFRHSMMLSGLGTHAKNAYDNAAMIFRELEEMAVATPGFAIRKGLQKAGANVEDGVSPQEIAGRMYSLFRTALDANTYKNTAKAFKKGHDNREVSSKVEMQDARIPVLGKVQDFLHASDVFFRAFHENANLYTLGVREARKQGFTGLAAFEEGSNLASTATPELREEARKMADIPLLVDKPSYLSAKLEAAKAIRPGMKGGEQVGAFAANFILPFFRVTDRLLFQKIRRMGPLALLDRVTRGDLAAGGPRMDIALGRMALSSALIWYYWDQAGEGNIKGAGPTDPEKKQALEAGGYLPNSIQTEDKFIDATALNLSVLPSNLQNSLAANIASVREAYESGLQDTESTGKAIAVATRALLSELSSTSFAENISTYLEPFQQGQEYEKDSATANMLAGAAGQFIPAAMRQYNQIVNDPVKRDTAGDKTIGDRITGRLKSAIPGLSDDLPVKHDVYGDPMLQGRTWSAINNYQPKKQDAVSKELQRLERTTKDAVVKGAPASFEYEGERIKLNAAGKQEWQRVQGYYLRFGMESVIKSPEWKQASDAEKVEIVQDLRTEAYEATKEYMLPLLGVTPQPEE